MEREKFMQEAINLSIESIAKGGGPFGAVVVKDGEIIAKASNSVTIDNDPTAHAEVNAIRAACRSQKSFTLDGAELYSSCEPCPMCLATAYWAGIKKIYFGNSREDAAAINFNDELIYNEIPLNPSARSLPSVQMMRSEAMEAFNIWHAKEDKVEY
ncbi:MAG: nucleoside deaminase [Rikenellaceae bacterium]